MATKKGKKATTTRQAGTKKTALARKRHFTLVTGGTGFLGAHLIRLLVDEGVKNLRVLATSAPNWLEELGVEVIQGSITSNDAVGRAVRDVADIYHLAGRVSRSNDDAHSMYSVHVDGTRVLCQAAHAAGVKSIVLASSSGTIAVADSPDITADEEWPVPVDIISRWPYYASKLYQERVALEHFSGRGERLVIMNPGLLLGPGDERLSSTRVVLDFLARKIMTVPSGGLSFVDVRDVARTFVNALERGKHGERYLLGSANWSFKDFFGRLERLTKVAAPRFALPSKVAMTGARGINALYRKWKLSSPVEPSEIEMADYFWYLDSSKAKDTLGFDPRDPAETLLDTVSYVKANFLGNDAFRTAG